MSMTEQPSPQPDRGQIAEHLERITARWHELPEPALLEIRALNSDHFTPVVQHFPLELLDEAADFCAHMSGLHRNIYAVRNPVRASAQGRAATDADVLAAFALFADCDAEQAANALRNFAGPRYTYAVTTGRVPHPRVHPTWELEEPITDMEVFADMQRRIAARLGSDPVVFNPSRIMRVAGTINWPTIRKAQRGHVPELCTIRTQYEQPRPPLRLADLQRAFARQEGGLADQAMQALASRTEASTVTSFGAPAHSGLNIDTGSLDTEAAKARALGGEEWHNNMIRAVASYVSRGLLDCEIHAITDGWTCDGYTIEQTRREVQQAINGARRKGFTPVAGQQKAGEAATEWTEPDPEQVPPLDWQAWQEIDLAAIPRVRFIYSDFYAAGYTSVTIAAPKTGKSALGLAEAIDVATGRGFLTGEKREPRVVVYYNAEDDQNVINSRVSAILTLYGIPQSEIVGRLFVVSGVGDGDFVLVSGDAGIIREDKFVALEKFANSVGAELIIFDPLQDLSDSPESNEVFRRLGRRLRKLASTHALAVGLIHHTRKIAPGMDPTIDDARGGSALRGTARFNRILAPMTEDEAVKAGVSNHRWYMRIADAESNLAPPSADVNRWFRKVSVETPSGEHVVAVEPWSWPDAFDGITPEQAIRVQTAIAQCDPPPRESIQAKDWAGAVIAKTLGFDAQDKQHRARVAALLRAWIASGVLARDVVFDKAKGREIPVVIRGPIRPGKE